MDNFRTAARRNRILGSVSFVLLTCALTAAGWLYRVQPHLQPQAAAVPAASVLNLQMLDHADCAVTWHI